MGRTDPQRVLRMFKRLSKQIDNWAVCDGLGMQFLRGIVKTHGDEIVEIAKTLNYSRDPWQRRLSLVMVEWYTRNGEMHQVIKSLLKNLEEDREYYVRKAVTWIKRDLQKGKSNFRDAQKNKSRTTYGTFDSGRKSGGLG